MADSESLQRLMTIISHKIDEVNQEWQSIPDEPDISCLKDVRDETVQVVELMQRAIDTLDPQVA